MRASRLIALALGLFWSSFAAAQDTFPTPAGNQNATGRVLMCPTATGAYKPCGSPGAQPIPVTLPNQNFTLAQPLVVTAIATGTTSAVTATFALVPNKTLYLCGVDISAIGGTAAIGPITITGLLGGTFTYQFTSTAGGVTFNPRFTPCIPAKDSATAIAIVTTADGTASAVDINAFGTAQ